MTHPAVFLDRDGTLVIDPGFLRRPDDVTLFPGAAQAVRRFCDAGFMVVVVTNQSGIGRGLITWDEYRAVAARVDELVAMEGGRISATYVCPHAPSDTEPCACRKPGLGHYREAARALSLVLERSVWIGDRLSDLEPAGAFGGRAIAVRTGYGGGIPERELARLGIETAPDLAGAAALVIPTPDGEPGR